MALTEDQNHFNATSANVATPSILNDTNTNSVQNMPFISELLREYEYQMARFCKSGVGDVLYVSENPVAEATSIPQVTPANASCYERQDAKRILSTLESDGREYPRSSSIVEELERDLNFNSADMNSNLTVQDDNEKSSDDVKIEDDDTTIEMPIDNKNCKEEEGDFVAIDISNPIQLQQNSMIVVNGKKCVLQYDLASEEIFAYPIKSPEKPKKKRGRPRKIKPPPVESGEKDDTQSQTLSSPPNESSAAASGEDLVKGFVETSNEAGEIVKRSARKRQKTREFNGIEKCAIELGGTSDEDRDSSGDDYDRFVSTKRGRGRGRSRGGSRHENVKQYSTSEFTRVGRGRGRPKKYGVDSVESSIQPVLLRLANGKSVQMDMPSGYTAQNILQNIAGLMKMPVDQFVLAPKQDALPFNTAPRLPTDTNIICEILETNDALTDSAPKICANNDMTSGHSINVSSEFKTESFPPSVINNCEEICVAESKKLEIMATNEDMQVKMETQSIDCEVVKNVDLEIRSGLTSQAKNITPAASFSYNVEERNLTTRVMSGDATDDIHFSCNKCDHQATSFLEYQQHIAVHSNSVYKCKCCPYAILDEDELFSHYKDTHPNAICSICNYTAANSNTISRHMQKHHDVSLKCAECGKIFKDIHVLKTHLKFVHRPSVEFYECNICYKKFNRKAHLARHIRTHDQEKRFKCELCEYGGNEKSDITKHMLVHKNPSFCCDTCGKTFRHKKNLELHAKRHNNQREFKCELCDYFGYTSTDVRIHIQRKHLKNVVINCQRDNSLQVCKNNELQVQSENSSATDTDSSPLDHTTNVTTFNAGDQRIEDLSNTLVQMPDGSLLSVNELLMNGQLVFTGN